MVDRFLRTSRGAGSGLYGRETRVLRDRQAAHESAIDRLGSGGAPHGAVRHLVQVYNGGSMGTSGNIVYLTHPVLLVDTETEGGSTSPVPDTGTTIPVLVLGAGASAGDYLVAYEAGGRWVAEKGGSPPAPCSTAPCNLPKSNLNLAWQFSTNPGGSGTTTIGYSSGCQWVTSCIPFGTLGIINQSFSFSVQLVSGVTQFTLVIYPVTNTTCAFPPQTIDRYYSDGSFTDMHPTLVNCGGNSFRITLSAFVFFTVTW
jgi:hypothetical protein